MRFEYQQCHLAQTGVLIGGLTTLVAAPSLVLMETESSRSAREHDRPSSHDL